MLHARAQQPCWQEILDHVGCSRAFDGQSPGPLARMQARPCRRRSYRTSWSGLLIPREIDKNDAGPACLTDMRNAVGDPARAVPFGNLKHSSGVMANPLAAPNITFALHLSLV